MFKDLMTREYELIKIGNFSYGDVERMSMSEFRIFYSILGEHIKMEKEAHEKAASRAKRK